MSNVRERPLNAKKWIWMNINFFYQSERAKSDIHLLG